MGPAEPDIASVSAAAPVLIFPPLVAQWPNPLSVSKVGQPASQQKRLGASRRTPPPRVRRHAHEPTWMPFDGPTPGLSIGSLGLAQLLLCVLWSRELSALRSKLTRGGVTKRRLFAGLSVTGR